MARRPVQLTVEEAAGMGLVDELGHRAVQDTRRLVAVSTPDGRSQFGGPGTVIGKALVGIGAAAAGPIAAATRAAQDDEVDRARARLVLAIDPGSRRSAYVVVDPLDGTVRDHGIRDNAELVAELRYGRPVMGYPIRVAACEWMQPRGMPTSAEEFETLYWIGRFAEALLPLELDRSVTRDKVKHHLTGQRSKVTDANVRAALIDRYGGVDGRAAAIGTVKAPGPLHGVANDEWAALGVAVTWADEHAEEMQR
jgi:hypothetical protein